ncbi:MAG: hypothetical protein ACRD88_10830, partial [Terriglobia bacterium]
LKALLLQKAQGNDDWKSNGKLRLETLLWGGDEHIWVVPAWVGWETVRFFFEYTAEWEEQGKHLTHAGGVVFCHHNAPIHRIRKLAEALCDEVKTKGGGGNRFAYQVLESFDHIGRDLEEHRKRFCKAGISETDLVLNGESMAEVAKAKKELERHEFARRKLHGIVHAILADNLGAVSSLSAELTRESAVDGALGKMRGCFGDSPAMWIHLQELWDYLR